MKVFSFFMLLLSPYWLPAQPFTIAAPKMNLVYIGVPNPITVVSGSCGCDALKVSVDKGKLVKTGDCRYDYEPSGQGNVQLTVSVQKDGKAKVIYTGYLRAKYIPAPYTAVGGRKSGLYPLHEFKAQRGVATVMEGFEMAERPYILSFSLIVTRGITRLAEEHVQGSLFDQRCKAAIAQLIPGDTVKIDNVKIGFADSRIQTIGSVVYTMK